MRPSLGISAGIRARSRSRFFWGESHVSAQSGNGWGWLREQPLGLAGVPGRRCWDGDFRWEKGGFFWEIYGVTELVCVMGSVIWEVW